WTQEQYLAKRASPIALHTSTVLRNVQCPHRLTQNSRWKNVSIKNLAGPLTERAKNYRSQGCLGLLLPCLDLGVDAWSDLRQRLKSLLGLLAVGAIRIELDRFLIGLRSARQHRHLHFVAYLLVLHRTDHRSAKQIPGLRALGIDFGRLLQWLDR